MSVFDLVNIVNLDHLDVEDQPNASAEAIVNVSIAVKSLQACWLQFSSKELCKSLDPS